jgi:biotin operon repressor
MNQRGETMNQDVIRRQEAKSRGQRFLNQMAHEFEYPPKIAQAILAEAEACLLGDGAGLQPGQMRVILLPRQAKHGPALGQMVSKEVTWTVDAGSADERVRQQEGAAGLRRHRLQRLVAEALEQEAVASQEDLARALQVSVRTIKRDCAQLQGQGIVLATRGQLHSIGRGQTHKSQIVGRWLRGETYDQIARHTYHSLTSIQRYVQTFTRVVQLQARGLTAEEISLTLQIGVPLVEQYLHLYQQEDSPFCRQRLADQLERLRGRSPEAQKGGR